MDRFDPVDANDSDPYVSVNGRGRWYFSTAAVDRFGMDADEYDRVVVAVDADSQEVAFLPAGDDTDTDAAVPVHSLDSGQCCYFPHAFRQIGYAPSTREHFPATQDDESGAIIINLDAS
jgi:hypothetical protein